MKSKKLRIAVLYGGKSAEHDVSLKSAKNVINALDKNKYEVTPIKIDKDGKINFTLNNIDLVFPVMHGPYGEDGSIQGFLKLANLPFVGSGVLGSAIGMDKDVTKRLLRDAGLPIGKFLVFERKDEIHFDDVKKELGVPFFVKPANLGSSIGVSKVKNEADFDQAVKSAFSYDAKIIIEEYTEGQEIECAVLGNENPIASIPGEIIPTHEFYDYEAKYIDAEGAKLKIPAGISDAKIKEIQALAIKAFKVLCLEGMSRIDFFLTKSGKILINEPNTIPGFTNISMYPKLWEKSGIAYPELIDRLIQLAIDRFKTQNKFRTTL
ncbi:MAG TPA: D-alanine--D-alanine ligase family protein [Candidatus Limnocylindrales bacterium]|nr:D-alanine--D-alanine ligase family protein [Candidatus Limnocylindrales bacterium]